MPGLRDTFLDERLARLQFSAIRGIPPASDYAGVENPLCRGKE
jgi:hypothetical protein